MRKPTSAPGAWRHVAWLALACTLLALTPAALARPAALPAPIARALTQAGMPPEALGLVIQPVGARQPALEWQADSAMNPASTMKLVTTLAGLELLGPAYTWRTEVYVDGAQQGDALDGNLVLKGHGDPRLTLESFWLLLKELRARGIRDIRGDLIVDRGFFLLPPEDPGRFDGAPTRPYNVIPDALLLNFKSTRVQFVPQPAAARVDVFAIPELAEVQLVNRLTTTDGPCEGSPERPLTAAPDTLVFGGSYPVECGERSRAFALLDPDRYALSLFRQLWTQLGGRFAGTIRAASVPADARLLMTWQSPPLAEIVRDINKFSNNVMARQLFLTLSAEESPPGTAEKSAGRVIGWMRDSGIDAVGTVLENGAGLSRSERISPRTLARILLRGFAGAWMPEYLASLPIVGVDGTTRRRLSGSPAAGRAHIKTGYLEGVRAIAGYVLDEHGRWIAVAAMLNHPDAGNAQGFMDSVIEWVYQTGGSVCCRRQGRCAGECPHRHDAVP